ncbi:hypothetical protein ACF1B0_14740 [Streptomyces anandii]|uniref:hypothetical protein n=1 Tax=Streptomyces anandii TaxID=285454 RepID=UPI0036FB08DE
MAAEGVGVGAAAGALEVGAGREGAVLVPVGDAVGEGAVGLTPGAAEEEGPPGAEAPGAALFGAGAEDRGLAVASSPTGGAASSAPAAGRLGSARPGDASGDDPSAITPATTAATETTPTAPATTTARRERRSDVRSFPRRRRDPLPGPNPSPTSCTPPSGPYPTAPGPYPATPGSCAVAPGP